VCRCVVVPVWLCLLWCVSPSLAHINRFVWAFNLVGSRALTIHGRKYLVPLADMFNYQPHGEERSADRGANFLKCVGVWSRG